MQRWILVAILIIASFLRLWNLDRVPVSMFGDELDVGYHAYSILKTWRDYSGNFLPLHFQSLAEWRTPLYLYSAVPTVGLFGISPWGVRLPAALFGILSVFGMYLFVKELSKYIADSSNPNTKKHETPNLKMNDSLALIAAFFLAISPWHIQYSRAAFEVTQLIAFLIFGLYFFIRALRLNGRGLWVSSLFFASLPWIYSTAKLFTPILLFILFFIWIKEIVRLPKNTLLVATICFVLVGAPIAVSTLWGGGTQRFGYIGIFTDPTIEPTVGANRLMDANVRGQLVDGLKPTFSDKLFHNKFTIWTDTISRNYFESLSFDFLFQRGDPNPRHSIKGVGLFYRPDVLLLVIGVITFFASKITWKIKVFFVTWIIFGILPAALTRDGGNHATRLILMLVPLIFLIAYGLNFVMNIIRGRIRFISLTTYFLLLTTSFIFYQHQYWVHNPWDSERWWHAGYKESFQAIREFESNYDRVIITMSSEPAWIFFAAHMQYDPRLWHEEFPVGNDTDMNGFGVVSYTGKYHFGSFTPPKGGIYDLGKYIDQKTLYLAAAKEIGANLIQEPERTPSDLQLLKAVAYPSGEPAYYLFAKK